MTSSNGPGAARHFYDLFNGHRHFDEICCKTGMSAAQLDELIENDPDVFVLRKWMKNASDWNQILSVNFIGIFYLKRKNWICKYF